MKLKEVFFDQWPRDVYALVEAIDKEQDVIKAQQIFDEFQCTNNLQGYYLVLDTDYNMTLIYIRVFIAA